MRDAPVSVLVSLCFSPIAGQDLPGSLVAGSGMCSAHNDLQRLAAGADPRKRADQVRP